MLLWLGLLLRVFWLDELQVGVVWLERLPIAQSGLAQSLYDPWKKVLKNWIPDSLEENLKKDEYDLLDILGLKGNHHRGACCQREQHLSLLARCNSFQCKSHSSWWNPSRWCFSSGYLLVVLGVLLRQKLLGVEDENGYGQGVLHNCGKILAFHKCKVALPLKRKSQPENNRCV